MRVFLIAGGYLIVPFILSLLFRILKINWVFITYFLYSIFVFYYPLLQIQVENFYNPELKNMKCGTGSAILNLANNICGIAIALMFQVFFNYLFNNTFFFRKKPFK